MRGYFIKRSPIDTISKLHLNYFIIFGNPHFGSNKRLQTQKDEKLFSREKIKWIFKRHPLLYYCRFILLSKNYKGTTPEDLGCYNDLNPIGEMPPIFKSVNANIPLVAADDTFEQSIAVATYLRNNIVGGPGLSKSSEKTLRLMLDGKGGVCSDFSQIFNNFCVVNNIQVREWNCVDRFYATQYGHTFNEIYSERLQKWIFMDVHQCFWVTNGESEVPLSTIEAFTRLRSGLNNQYHFFVPAFEPESKDRLNHIYSKESIPFLTIEYRNKVIDGFLNATPFRMPVFLITSAMILARKNFKFLFVLDNYKDKLFNNAALNAE